MTNLEKYHQVLKRCLRLEDGEINENLMYNRHKNWDSVAHIDMISELEEVFGISYSTLEIMRFSTYEKGIEILEKKGVSFDR